MTLIILSIILVGVLLDFSLIGFLPKIFNIWPSLKKLINGKLIEDNALYSIRTDIKNKSGHSIITNRINYKSIILTKNYLIVKNTYLTCLFYISIDKIDSYSIKKKLFTDVIEFYLNVDGNKNFLLFKTKKLEIWIENLRKLKIVKQE